MGATESASRSMRPADERISCLEKCKSSVRARLPSICNSEVQLGARAKEHAYGYCIVCTEERAHFRRAHSRFTSVHPSSGSMHIPDARNSEAHLGVRVEEHVLEHPGVCNRGEHIKKHVPQGATCACQGHTARAPRVQ